MKIKKMSFVVFALCLAFVISCAGDPEPVPPPPPVQETVSAVVAPPPAQETVSVVAAPSQETVSAVITAPSPQPSQNIILDGAQTYNVVTGDTLSSIAGRYYGNGYYYPIIVLGSGSLITDIDLIEPGMSLTIPNLQRNLDNSGSRARIKSYLREVAAINDNRGRTIDGEELRKLSDSL